MHLATEQGVLVSERHLTVNDLVTADEVFLTGSVAEVVPVITVAGDRIGEGRPGPMTTRMQRLYRGLVLARST
jgi:branched-chain amino acid aminotransferase